ncbi:hypothetical protein [Candidatus Accumulibacter sp. ACC003]|uniref:hypothetical protein n=1 Tax=Candidatus Accumulibacter sp. ACC003 TaxID=2823334 RepID=UPI0025BA887E|nr:hypothetical protein [Candidatus Accumulibacter sp. ACC003]
MPEVLDRCQACRARLAENAVCPRCGCDFSLARQALVQGRCRLEQALRSLASGDRAAARAHVDASLALNRLRMADALKSFLADERQSTRTAPAEDSRVSVVPPRGGVTEPARHRHSELLELDCSGLQE